MTDKRESLIRELAYVAGKCHDEGIIFAVEEWGEDKCRIVFFDAWDYMNEDVVRYEAEYAYTIQNTGWIDDGTLKFFDVECIDEEWI